MNGQRTRAFVLTLAQCWHTLCQHRSREVLERSNSTFRQVLAQSVLTAVQRGVRTHWRRLGASLWQYDVKDSSNLLKIASSFFARFRSQANTCSNSVPTAALAGVRTLCHQQNQGRCWPQKRANSRPWCATVTAVERRPWSKQYCTLPHLQRKGAPL